MWKFFEFLVTVRTVLYPLVKPYIHCLLLSKNTDTEEEVILQLSIRRKVNGVPAHIHKTQLLADFAKELDKYRKDLTRSLGNYFYQFGFYILHTTLYSNRVTVFVI